MTKHPGTSANIIRLHPIGGFAWRRARGLLTIEDQARLYRARRFVRHPLQLAPLPEDLLPRYRKEVDHG